MSALPPDGGWSFAERVRQAVAAGEAAVRDELDVGSGPLLPDATWLLYRDDDGCVSPDRFYWDLACELRRREDAAFLYGDGSPQPPIPVASPIALLRWTLRRRRYALRVWLRRLRRRAWLDPRERLALRVAPWLLTDAAARDRYLY